MSAARKHLRLVVPVDSEVADSQEPASVHIRRSAFWLCYVVCLFGYRVAYDAAFPHASHDLLFMASYFAWALVLFLYRKRAESYFVGRAR